MRSILAANRSEIAIRIFRAANEIGLRTIAIYSREDRLSLHRFKADEAYEIGAGKGPVEAYLDIAGIVRLRVERKVDAIHPGYGFLSENARLPGLPGGGHHLYRTSARITRKFSEIKPRRVASASAGVPVLPGTDTPIKSFAEARRFARGLGFPLIIKAAMGGGGRGMRVVSDACRLEPLLEEAREEARSAFGDPSVFLEKYMPRARHIEVQILADHHGNILHLWERDCSVQRRHQKVVEVAPAQNLSPSLHQELCDAAVRISASRKLPQRGNG